MWNKETNRPDDWECLIADAIQKSYQDNMSIREIADIGANAIVEPAKAEGRRGLIEWLKEHTADDTKNAGFYTKPRYFRVMSPEIWQQLLKELK